MKVIGKAKEEMYLCEVSHSEIEKFMDLYYGNMKELEVGSEINLADGHDWYSKTKKALDDTKAFFNSNIRNIDAITKAFTMTIQENKE